MTAPSGRFVYCYLPFPQASACGYYKSAPLASGALKLLPISLCLA
jgi:hypothetical protein